jgi:hypothetical protein
VEEINALEAVKEDRDGGITRNSLEVIFEGEAIASGG